MKNLLAASALILAIAAPAAAQTMDTGMDAGSSTIHRTRDQGAATDQTQTLSDADGEIDTSTTQSIAPMADYGMRAGRDDSSPMREDTSDNNSRAVGGRSN